MADRYSPPPPEGFHTPEMLAARWDTSRRTVYEWLYRGWLKGEQPKPRKKPKRVKGARWLVTEDEAQRWEQEHPRLRAKLAARASS